MQGNTLEYLPFLGLTLLSGKARKTAITVSRGIEIFHVKSITI